MKPQEHLVSVFRSSTQVQELTEQDTLLLENALSGFRVSVADLFATRPQK